MRFIAGCWPVFVKWEGRLSTSTSARMRKRETVLVGNPVLGCCCGHVMNWAWICVARYLLVIASLIYELLLLLASMLSWCFRVWVWSNSAPIITRPMGHFVLLWTCSTLRS